MNKEFAEHLLQKCSGDFSVFYPLLKEEVKKMNLNAEESFGLQDMMFFEDDYLMYYLNILKRKNKTRKIIDIGCQLGFQSYIFDDFDYTGIDVYGTKFFRQNGEKSPHYIIGDFTKLDIDISDSIVISNMSLGYFNSWTDFGDKEIAQKLSKANYLYIASTETLLRELEQYYDYKEIISQNKILDSTFTRMYFERKNGGDKAAE